MSTASPVSEVTMTAMPGSPPSPSSPGPLLLSLTIVSCVDFGAGLIITRRGAVHGLTTAAAIWECAAIGMAAGAGLLLLAVTVTALHFVIILGFKPLARRLTSRLSGTVRLHITYQDGRKLFVLTDTGRKLLEERGAEEPAPWEQMSEGYSPQAHELGKLMREVASAFVQVMRNGSDEQMVRAPIRLALRTALRVTRRCRASGGAL